MPTNADPPFWRPASRFFAAVTLLFTVVAVLAAVYPRSYRTGVTGGVEIRPGFIRFWNIPPKYTADYELIEVSTWPAGTRFVDAWLPWAGDAEIGPLLVARAALKRHPDFTVQLSELHQANIPLHLLVLLSALAFCNFAFLQPWLRRRRTRCRICGCDLNGALSGDCPACGRPLNFWDRIGPAPLRRFWARFTALGGLLLFATMFMPMFTCGRSVPIEELSNLAIDPRWRQSHALDWVSATRDACAILLVYGAPFGFGLLVAVAAFRRAARLDAAPRFSTAALLAFIIACAAALGWCVKNGTQLDTGEGEIVYFDLADGHWLATLALPLAFCTWLLWGIRIWKHADLFISFWGAMVCFLWAARWMSVPCQAFGFWLALLALCIVAAGSIAEASMSPSQQPGIDAVMSVLFGRRIPQPGCCAQCDYDLAGNTSGRCPECGASCVAENQ